MVRARNLETTAMNAHMDPDPTAVKGPSTTTQRNAQENEGASNRPRKPHERGGTMAVVGGWVRQQVLLLHPFGLTE